MHCDLENIQEKPEPLRPALFNMDVERRGLLWVETPITTRTRAKTWGHTMTAAPLYREKGCPWLLHCQGVGGAQWQPRAQCYSHHREYLKPREWRLGR